MYVFPQIGTGKLRGILDSIKRSLVQDLTLRSHTEALLVARALEARLKEEYIRGGHNERTDEQRRGHDPAINDTQVYAAAFGAVCSLGPIWRLLQFGWREHVITGNPLLTFKIEDRWVSTHEVINPGYRGDDIVGRAMASLDLAPFALRVVSDAYARILTRF